MPCSTWVGAVARHAGRATRAAAAISARSRRGRPGSPRGWRCTSAGVPSAILRPKFSATTWSEIAHHQAHVMLDQQHRDAQPVADVADQRAERADLFVVEPAGRLVEQQQLRLGRPARAPARPASACRTAVRATGASATAPRPRKCDQLAPRVRRLPRSSAPTRGRRSALARKPLRGAAVARRPARCRARSCCGTARGSGTCGRCRARRCGGAAALSSARPSKRMLAALAVVEPRQAVEQRGLAGAVGADQTGRSALRPRRTTRRRARRCRRSAPTRPETASSASWGAGTSAGIAPAAPAIASPSKSALVSPLQHGCRKPSADAAPG